MFLWNANTGAVGLGDLPGNTINSQAHDVSTNGSVVVGFGNPASGSGAAIWTRETGIIALQGLLIDEGLNLDGWTLVAARGVCADGTIITGYGTNPDGKTEGWIAHLDLPEPAKLKHSVEKADNQTALLTFNTAAGYYYDVQYSTDLDGWNSAESSIPGTGEDVTRVYEQEDTSLFIRVCRSNVAHASLEAAVNDSIIDLIP